MEEPIFTPKIDDTTVVGQPIKVNTTTEKPKEDETVTVNKKTLNELLGRLDRLESSADLSRLSKYDNKHKITTPTVVRLSTHGGKTVLGWKMVLDEVVKSNGIWRENQIIQLKFEDDTTIDIPYLRFVQDIVKVDAIILSRTKDSDGGETLKVQRKDNGKEYIIDIRFVN